MRNCFYSELRTCAEKSNLQMGKGSQSLQEPFTPLRASAQSSHGASLSRIHESTSNRAFVSIDFSIMPVLLKKLGSS